MAVYAAQRLDGYQTGRGVAYGIDPWTKQAALEGMIDPENIHFWDQCPYEITYTDCVKAIKRLGLQGYCRLIRAQAHTVANQFAEISVGLLHLDGNHSAEPTIRETREWFPKVAVGGFIVVDDIAWKEADVFTVRPAVEWMLERGCAIVDQSVRNCLVLEKRCE
ncbi:MAG: class I SAM-dependent methyltransferase [Planctomycetes bacterium]|nr:class I SAM-dependent methyltransferase [Planctomycetota bacterium]